MNFLNKEGLSTLWANIIAKLDNKVDKLTGKGLSTNDFTNEYKNKLDSLTPGGGGSYVEPMFELIGSWRWEDIDMRLDPSYSSAVGNSGTIGKYLEVPLNDEWTIINPYRTADGVGAITRIARYNFPDGKAYKKVIAMMSFDPNYIPEGYISPLEQSRGFKTGVNYGQKFEGNPAYSTVRFIGDMGGISTLGYIESHNKASQGFVKVANTKEGGLWTLTRTERTDNPGNRSDLRHYQGGFYGSYDSIQPIFHEEPYDASILGSYERVTGFEFETVLPWYDTDGNGSGDNLNNLRGMLSLYGIPEDDPETVYGLKFHDITLVNNTGKFVACRTKQYEGGVVCTTVYNIGLNSLDVTVKTASGKTIEGENLKIKYHTNASHHNETRGYITFDMPNEDVTITINGEGDEPSTGERYHYGVGNWPYSLESVEIYPIDGIVDGVSEGWATAGSEVEVYIIGNAPDGYWYEVADPTGKESPIEVHDSLSFIMPNYDVVINIYERGEQDLYVTLQDNCSYTNFIIEGHNEAMSWTGRHDISGYAPGSRVVVSVNNDGVDPQWTVETGRGLPIEYWQEESPYEIVFTMPDESVCVTIQ